MGIYRYDLGSIYEKYMKNILHVHFVTEKNKSCVKKGLQI